jgi:ABC-type sugar transport system ATPase subunit
VNAFVAGFIGNPPMNLLPGRLASDANGGASVVAGGTLRLVTPALHCDRRATARSPSAFARRR